MSHNYLLNIDNVGSKVRQNLRYFSNKQTVLSSNHLSNQSKVSIKEGVKIFRRVPHEHHNIIKDEIFLSSIVESIEVSSQNQICYHSNIVLIYSSKIRNIMQKQQSLISMKSSGIFTSLINLQCLLMHVRLATEL